MSENVLSLTIPTTKEIIFSLFILLRVLGMFVISPLLSNRVISTNMRFFLAFGTTLLLSIVLYPQYLGPNPKYPFNMQAYDQNPGLFLILMMIKELSVGYLIGFFFNIIFEAMLLAGELIDSMIGFSAAQFLDPFSNTFQSLIGQLLVLTGGMVMVIADLHHIFVRMIAESFNIIPVGNMQMTGTFLQETTMGMSFLFAYAIKIGTIPIIILACGLIGVAFTIRVVPEMNILLTGLPMRVMIGIYTLMLAIRFIIPAFNEGFWQLTALVQSIIYSLGNK